jgi:hypothetical protein
MPAGQFTRDTLNLAGHWTLTYVTTLYRGRPVGTDNPLPWQDPQVFTTGPQLPAWRQPNDVSPPGNEPVYQGDMQQADGSPGAVLTVSPFVSPRGIVLTMWHAGNPDTGFTDAYTANSVAHADNDGAPDLQALGTWIDVTGNAGTVTFQLAPAAE